MIYSTEPMATRALAAEIRHDHRRFVRFLEQISGEVFGSFQRVQCEAQGRTDVQLDFDVRSVGIEAKLDHELTVRQVEKQLGALGDSAVLFVLLPNLGAAPMWLDQYPGVFVIDWATTLDCFVDSRLTIDDINGDRLLKSTVEAWLVALALEEQLPGWQVQSRRGGGGMPSIVFESPELPDGRTLRGQLEVAGRGMPTNPRDARFISHVGVAVPEDSKNYFDPASSDEVPGWIEHLRTLDREVLRSDEKRLLISRRAPGHSTRELGQWKTPLARKHLGEKAYLAKGYTDGWAIGPKTATVGRERLDELAGITVEIFARWYAAETS